jgi:hypothetical protein
MAVDAVSLDIAGTREFRASQVRQGARAVQDAGGGIKDVGAADAARGLIDARNAGRAFGQGRRLDLAA